MLFNGIGKIQFRYSKRAKYIRIVISHCSEVYVVIPKNQNINEAINFVHSKREWIQKSKTRIANKKVLKLKLSNVELVEFWGDTKQKMPTSM